ncbi:DUF6519 domain-containing protein [Massilia horti]|uniref:Uncharacterized protein n=1 Tax=Massilia horti TaxID=2562153 RepID=A0A4Y9SYL9_9BURK|nr:DUF6519 domain-containing protein [Massilia horti]TFW31748.1 hypothetical protein E4O92_12415 [Massilia horti]
MKGDFTRNTFDSAMHFSRVLMQQGRVQLDADWNEQADIVLHLLRSLTSDLIGPHGGAGDGFLVQPRKDRANDFLIGSGRYYVGGIMCENDGGDVGYAAQTGVGVDPDLPVIRPGTYLAYLDVWERHLTSHEVPRIRETALGGPDTATRARVEWLVKLLPVDATPPLSFKDYAEFLDFLKRHGRFRLSEGRLMAGVAVNTDMTNACVVPADNRYRGLENQLYRVEIHHGGKAWNGSGDKTIAASFKWSRDNGSVVFPVAGVQVNGGDRVTTTVTLKDLGRDRKTGLAKDDWVELVDDAYVLRNGAQPLLRVLETDSDNMTVILDGEPGPGVGTDPGRHPLLRRWDQRLKTGTTNPANDGALLVQADSTTPDGIWIKLEDGIQVRFEAGRTYSSGDYWLIPARTGTGNIEWPEEGDPRHPSWVQPRGDVHYYAPLALASVDASGKQLTVSKDFRRRIKDITA